MMIAATARQSTGKGERCVLLSAPPMKVGTGGIARLATGPELFVFVLLMSNDGQALRLVVE